MGISSADGTSSIKLHGQPKMDSMFKTIRADAIIERVSTKSVLNPLLWLCGICEIFAVPAAVISKGGLQVFLCCLAGLPVIAAIIAYFIFMFRDPDRLQSEDYQINRQKISHGTKEEENVPLLEQTNPTPTILIEGVQASEPDELPETPDSPPEIEAPAVVAQKDNT